MNYLFIDYGLHVRGCEELVHIMSSFFFTISSKLSHLLKALPRHLLQKNSSKKLNVFAHVTSDDVRGHSST